MEYGALGQVWLTRGCSAQVSAEEWDACASGNGVVNPFLLHAFLLALEITGCAVRYTLCKTTAIA
jgi:predicted N-acyltransferase